MSGENVEVGGRRWTRGRATCERRFDSSTRTSRSGPRRVDRDTPTAVVAAGRGLRSGVPETFVTVSKLEEIATLMRADRRRAVLSARASDSGFDIELEGAHVWTSRTASARVPAYSTRRSPRSRRAVGVGDVAGERGDRQRMRGLRAATWIALARLRPDVELDAGRCDPLEARGIAGVRASGGSIEDDLGATEDFGYRRPTVCVMPPDRRGKGSGIAIGTWAASTRSRQGLVTS